MECPFSLFSSCSTEVAPFAAVATCFVAPGAGDGNPLVIPPSGLFSTRGVRKDGQAEEGAVYVPGNRAVTPSTSAA